MNDITLPQPPNNASWPTRANRAGVPDTSLLPGSEKPPAPAAGLLNHAVQGAHDTIDRLADTATPAVRQIDEGVSAAGDALHAKAELLRDTGAHWTESVRSSVCRNPLSWVAGALALGAALVSISGKGRGAPHTRR